MGDNSEVVKCRDCGLNLDVRPDEPLGKRTPCPSSGSISREFEITLSEVIRVSTGIGTKAKHKGEKKPFVE
jgi:hypothetical protein